MDLEETLFWINHASFYIKTGGETVFIDPFRVPDGLAGKADLVLVTHAHFDHCSKEDIRKVAKKGAGIIAAPGCLDKGEFPGLSIARPGSRIERNGVIIEAVPAYNIRKERLKYHPRSNDWVGYVIGADGRRIYHAGDTDFVEEMRSLKGISAALLPVGGTYTMDVSEAIEAARAMKPEFVVPMHYKNLLGRDGSEAAEKKIKSALPNALMLKEVTEATYAF